MKIDGIIWLRDIVDKLAFKHHVEQHEVEETLNNEPKVRFIEKGERKGEDVYMARNRSKRLPKFESLSDLVKFFDPKDMGEYWDQMPEVDVDISIKRRKHLVAIYVGAVR